MSKRSGLGGEIVTDELPDQDELLLEAAQLRMQAETIIRQVAEAKVPILAMLAEWKEWATEQNKQAAQLGKQATSLEHYADELYPDPNAQHAKIAWQ